MLSKHFQEIEIATITVGPDRQRKDLGDIAGLKESISRLGLINPIVITRELVLVAGERRLTACRALGLKAIPVQFTDQLSAKELACIELEENIKRKQLSWQEETEALAKLHAFNVELKPGWTLADTSKLVGLDSSTISHAITVSKELASDKIANAPTMNAARNILRKKAERASANEFNSILESTLAMVGDEDKPETESAPAVAPAPAPESILNTNAIEWMDAYEGPRFNFLHCDFPYGINFNSGTQVSQGWTAYNDDPDVYWELLRALARNQHKLFAPSSHLMFWFSMKFYRETLAFFETQIPRVELNHFPLVWHKSDGKGLLPDPLRGPRRIYETAFMGSCGDRKIISAVANTYAAPTGKADALHVSEKPLPVLKHFFKMFVDDSTTLLDPTCGSGTALRAAESYSAKSVLGLELDPEHFANASAELRKFRILQKVTA